jgi:hypothetical protein
MTAVAQRRILRAVARGTPLVHAANAAGMTFQTLSTHRSKNPAFAAALAKAVAKGVEAKLKVVERATKSKDEAVRLRAACWYLEHVHPESFARNRIELTGADGSPLAVGIGIYLPQKDDNEIKPCLPATVTAENEN